MPACPFPSRRAALFALAAAMCLAPPATGEPLPDAAAVPVAMLVDDGVFGKGPRAFEETCRLGGEFRVVRVTGAEVRDGALRGCRALVLPGGSGRRQSEALGAAGRAAVKAFAAEGGTCVGICGGCFLMTAHYPWSLHLLPAGVVDAGHWERGHALLPLGLTAEGKGWLNRTALEAKAVYHNGPVLAPLPDAGENWVPLATYGAEVACKGAKEGLMVGTAAVAAARCGKGWAIGVSPHPEQSDGLKDLVPAAMRWALAHPPGK